jgi:hypothetical protein
MAHHSRYVLQVQHHHNYGQIKLSSTPRVAYSTPGIGGAIRLYQVYTPACYPGAKKYINIIEKKSDLTAADLKGAGKTPPEPSKEDFQAHLRDMKQHPIKVSLQEFKDLQQSKEDDEPPKKKKRMKTEDHYVFN